MEAVEEGDDGVEALRVVVVELVLGLVNLEEDDLAARHRCHAPHVGRGLSHAPGL